MRVREIEPGKRFLLTITRIGVLSERQVHNPYYFHDINAFENPTMKYFTYENGDKMPLFGLGTWKSEDRDAYSAVKEAIKMGYRHIDCAARYDNEAEIGEAISECIDEGIVKRDELWITSKLWNNAHFPQDVEPNIRQTLADLRLEYLDLYLMHWPVAIRPDVIFPAKGDELLSLDEIPLIDTWKAMAQLKEKGLCRHIGVSNFNIPKMDALVAQGGVKPECNQVESHPLLQQPELLSYCAKNHIAYTAYSPLGSKDRPARVVKDTDPILLENETIANVAKEANATPGQVLIAWAINRDTAVIPKSSNKGRLQQNLSAAEITLSDDHMDEIKALDISHRFIDGTIWTIEGSPYTLEGLWEK